MTKDVSHINPLDENIVFTRDLSLGDNLTRRDLLECLIEECAEVIQAATKCLRFGFDRDWPGYGVNHEKLLNECSDARVCMEYLVGSVPVPHKKIERIMKWKKYMREHPEHGPQIPTNV